jgi:hypothetical protein
VKKVFTMILLVPFAIVGGLFWGVAADKIAKDKEPWFTLLMLCGLAISVIVMTLSAGASVRAAAWVFVGTGTMYVGLRWVFGSGSALEMFFAPHLLAVMILWLLPALDRVRHKAQELKEPNPKDSFHREAHGSNSVVQQALALLNKA